MVEANDDEDQGASTTASEKVNKPVLPEEQLGRLGEMFKGLAKMTREFEQCPRGSRVTERLMYFAMTCGVIVVVAVTYIRFGH